jgi:hypothetical protein
MKDLFKYLVELLGGPIFVLNFIFFSVGNRILLIQVILKGLYIKIVIIDFSIFRPTGHFVKKKVSLRREQTLFFLKVCFYAYIRLCSYDFHFGHLTSSHCIVNFCLFGNTGCSGPIMGHLLWVLYIDGNFTSSSYHETLSTIKFG